MGVNLCNMRLGDMELKEIAGKIPATSAKIIVAVKRKMRLLNCSKVAVSTFMPLNRLNVGSNRMASSKALHRDINATTRDSLRNCHTN